MLVRRNSKEFKAIRNILYEFAGSKSKEELIKLYITKAGYTVKDRIAVEGLGEGRALYYHMTYETILHLLDSADHLLHQSDTEPGLYYFQSRNNRLWDETPFQLAPKLIREFNSYATREVSKPTEVRAEKEQEEAAKRSKHVSAVPPPAKTARPAVKRKGVEKNKETKEPHRRGNKKLQKEVKEMVEEKARSVPDHTRVARNKPAASPAVASQEPKALEEQQPEYHLKHVIRFHDLKKIWFPELRLTKKDVLDYYDRMSGYILPYLKDRPQSFRWHRKDIYDSEYNKSMSSLLETRKVSIPEWIKKIRTYTKSHEEDRDFMLCQDKEHLFFMVEIGCIEFSPWHSRMRSLDAPDYLVIDLAPLDIDFAAVVETAHAAKEVLDGLQIPFLVKTSGNKGLHLYLPLDSKTDQDTGRKLAEFICRLIHLKIPNSTSLDLPKDKRLGKVHLNYGQNGRGKTITAAYSLRPNNFAGVSTPMLWEEVKENMDIRDYNIHTIFRRLETSGDIFGDLMKKKINAGRVLEKLEGNYGFLL